MTYTNLMNKETVNSIYTCLEMLRASGLDEIVQYWCNHLYTENGDCWLPSWNERNLAVMENDCIHYA
jgi:hypothetical protein